MLFKCNVRTLNNFLVIRKNYWTWTPKRPKMSTFWGKSENFHKFSSVRIDHTIRFLSTSAISMIFLFPMSHHRAKMDKNLTLRRCLHTTLVPHLFRLWDPKSKKSKFFSMFFLWRKRVLNEFKWKLWYQMSSTCSVLYILKYWCGTMKNTLFWHWFSSSLLKLNFVEFSKISCGVKSENVTQTHVSQCESVTLLRVTVSRITMSQF